MRKPFSDLFKRLIRRILTMFDGSEENAPIQNDKLYNNASSTAVKQSKNTAWTENNDGVTLPENMDASQHSGFEPEEIESIPEHDHKFKRGILPGNICMKSCSICGETVSPITREEWLTLA